MKNLFSFHRSGFFYRRLMGLCVLSILVLGVMQAAPFGLGTVHAAGGAAEFGLQPVLYDPSNPLTKSYFIFDSKPGVVISSRVRVTNVGTASGSVSLYPVDATTGQTSGAVYLNQDDPRKDVGAWMLLSSSELTLDPGQSQIVSFQVSIPGTVRPGQHLGGIVAENLTQAENMPTPNSSPNTGTIQIKVKNLTIVAVQVNLPGTPIEQMAASGVQAGGAGGYQRLLVGLSNTGTVMLKPYGTLQVSNAQGQSVGNFTLKLDTFLPQTSIDYPVAITGPALGAGDYQATLNLTYGHGQALHYTTKFTINQQQVTQVFGSSQTQAPTGGAVFAGMPLWQLVLVAGGALAILWVVGNMVYKRLALSRAKQAKSYSSQFKRPTFR
jgi:WxL Interacting Protein, peptidoglycan binding domain/WxL Interacting Protein, host binding domain